MTLRLSLPIDRALILHALALLAFVVVVGIFVHSIVPLGLAAGIKNAIRSRHTRGEAR